MSCHSSPQNGLATLVNRITLPLRSTPVTEASSLLRAAPPLVLASVFFLMVSATCHFPLHPERSSHVPYRSLYRVHAAYTPAAARSVNRFLPGLSWSICTAPVLTAPYSGFTITVSGKHNPKVPFSSRKRHFSRNHKGHANCETALVINDASSDGLLSLISSILT